MVLVQSALAVNLVTNKLRANGPMHSSEVAGIKKMHAIFTCAL